MKSSILQNVKNNVLLVAEKAYPALSAKNFFNLSSVSIGKSLLPLMCRLNCVKVVPIFSATKLFFSPVLSSFSLTDKFLFFMPTKVWCKILFSKLFVKLIFQSYLCLEQTMKGMKQQPTDKETAKYNAVAELSALLRETTTKRMSFPTGHHPSESSSGMWVYDNSIFSKEEHETVKRAFLRLVSEI